jgi:heterodisulfide reductase subunit A-like polyferredoxin
MSAPRILYCNCTYAQVVPKEVKEAVLKKLCESGIAFEAVADLCEMSARRDSSLQRLAEGGAVKIAACYPRAVKWLFAAAGAPLPEQGVEVLNMREQPAAAVVHSILGAKG